MYLLQNSKVDTGTWRSEPVQHCWRFETITLTVFYSCTDGQSRRRGRVTSGREISQPASVTKGGQCSSVTFTKRRQIFCYISDRSVNEIKGDKFTQFLYVYNLITSLENATLSILSVGCAELMDICDLFALPMTTKTSLSWNILSTYGQFKYVLCKKITCPDERVVGQLSTKTVTFREL